MKVKLRYKKLEDLPSKKRQEILSEYGGYNLYYLDNEYYTVYAIEFWNGNPFYYICDDVDDNYPVPKPADFFEIIDDRVSKHWVFKLSRDNDCVNCSLVFPEWRDNPNFYEELLEEEGNAEQIFILYKKLLDEEFSER